MRARVILASRWVVHNWPYLALIFFVFLPMLWMAASLAFRSGLIGGSGTPSSDQVKTFLTFIGGGLATAVTMVGALLTREHNARERRRLQLETVIKSLDSLPAEAKQRVPAVLSTMVLLGQQRIAVRVLEPAWDKEYVDDATATWIIDQVITGDVVDRSHMDIDRPDEASVTEASVLLQQHSPYLTKERARDFCFLGHFQEHWSFPRHPLDKWRKRKRHHEAKNNVLLSMGKMFTSRDRDWWCPSGAPPRWPTVVLLECVETDFDPLVKEAAAVLFGALVDCFPRSLAKALTPVRVETALRVRSEACKNKRISTEYFHLADVIREKFSSAQPVPARPA